MQFIGIDVGTLSTKGCLVAVDGRVLCRAAISHETQSPRPGWVEQDPEAVWWAETCEIIRRLLEHPDADTSSIAGLGVSGMFPALALVDEGGQPLRPALLYSDNRAARELAAFNERFGLILTGDALPPKLAWLRANEPDIFSQARYFLSSHNYVGFRLTGAYYLDYKVADSMGGLLDRTTLKWREDVADWAGIDVAHLPRLCSESEIAGEVTQSAAEETGLKAGTPLVVGSGDSPLTIISAGAIERGDALLSLGTSGWMGVLPYRLAEYYENPTLLHQGAPYLLEAYVLAVGSALRWFRDQFAVGEQAVARRLGTSAYKMLDDEAAKVPPGSDGLIVLPYFLGGREPEIPLPETATMTGLTLSHTAAHVYRALLESYGYVVRWSLERLEERGIPVKRIVATGGGASSKLWRQILSDIIGQPLHYHADTDPCLANAYLVGYALGSWDSLEGIRDWLPPSVVAEPSENAHLIYDKVYHRFLALQLMHSK